MVVFALVICILGGNNADVSQLYYDADFVELYDTEDNGSSGEREFKGGKRLDAEAKTEEAPLELSDNSIPTDTFVTPEVDTARLSQEIYDSVDM